MAGLSDSGWFDRVNAACVKDWYQTGALGLDAGLWGK